MKSIRTKRTREQWLELVEQWQTSNLNAKSWCLENEVSYESFIIWRKRLKDSSRTSNSFIELKDSPSTTSGIEIHYHRIRIILCKDFDPDSLLCCIQVLEKL